MNQTENNDRIEKIIEETANSAQPNVMFMAELEEKLRTAHRPFSKSTFLSLSKLSPTLSLLALLTVLAILMTWLFGKMQPQAGSTGEFTCPVTEPNGSLPPGETVESEYYLGNGELWTVLWPYGTITMLPENRQTDGSFGMKWGWWRGMNGALTIEGRRLDAPAEPLRADIPEGYGETGFQVSALIFPSTGCWEVTGRVGEVSLTFVTKVVYGVATPTPNISTDNSKTSIFDYTVQNGDTCGMLANKYRITVEELMAVNGLQDCAIFAGQVLKIPIQADAAPEPQGGGYDFRGTKLYLSQPLPQSPTEANVYLLRDDQHATVEGARALAQRFGLDGEIYQAPGQPPNTADYFFTDGKQSLSVSSNLLFIYTADMERAYNNFTTTTNPNAETIIDDFLKSHGFDFPHKTEPTELYGGYVVEPLSPDGFPMRYEFYSSRPMLVTLDEDGQVLRFEANLMNYESTDAQTYGIIPAEEAFQKLLDDNSPVGKIESTHSASNPIKEWRRVHPANETITIYGYASSTPALDSSKPAFIQIDGYTATGNTNGIDALGPNAFIAATGKFINENGIQKFNIESWKLSEASQDGLVGTLRRDGAKVILSTPDQGEYTLVPDVPADVPMPFENAYVIGVKIGNTFEWTLIDDRMSTGGGGGGGGGGGLGFYKLNLSGTPVPFPTPTQLPAIFTDTKSLHYTVKEGDTLSQIAETYNIPLEELMQANGLAEATVFIGQALIIPGVPKPTRLDGERGMVSVNIYNKPDGSQRVEYLFIDEKNQGYYKLEGDRLETLQAFVNRPMDLWGTLGEKDNNGAPILAVERFENPYPDLQFQIMHGAQKFTEINGSPVVLFTTSEGKTFIQLSPSGSYPDSAVIGVEGDQVSLEALEIPNETYAGYPTIRVFNAAMTVNPKNGEITEMAITADKPSVMDDPYGAANSYTPPTATVEKAELIYYVTNQHWQVDHLDGGPQYIQPAWKFTGHYSNGDEFEILVQALEQEFLSPELAPYIQGG